MTVPHLIAGPFVEAGHALGEGPLWFDDRWWWLDIEAGSLHSCDASGGDLWSHVFGRKITAAGAGGEGRLLLAFERSLEVWNSRSGRLELQASLEDEPSGNRLNDGKWDPAGRFLVGTLNKNGDRGISALYSFQAGQPLKKLLAGIDLSNGLAWAADAHTFYHVDSLSREIAAYDFDVGSGDLSRRRVVVRVPAEMGLPDGMDIDTAGRLWVAHWGGGAVRCWDPRDGSCLAEIRVPCSQVTSCRFGGRNADRLIITSARTGLSGEDLKKEPLAGSVFICDPGARGFPERIF